jgi:hypothetical protein
MAGLGNVEESSEGLPPSLGALPRTLGTCAIVSATDDELGELNDGDDESLAKRKRCSRAGGVSDGGLVLLLATLRGREEARAKTVRTGGRRDRGVTEGSLREESDEVVDAEGGGGGGARRSRSSASTDRGDPSPR